MPHRRVTPGRMVFAFRHWALLLLVLGRAALAQETPESAPGELPPQQAPPLHVRIDQHIARTHLGTPAPIAGDAEFLRRITLSLTGTIPTAAETRAFLDDAAPDKRAVLIDRLLGSLRYPRQMAYVFDVMLMERRADKYVPAAQWHEYLRSSFAANKPLDQLYREILTADGTDPALRPAAKFILDREAEPNLVTRDLGRMVFGRDLQCAQCHDHPIISEYYQTEYHGLMAFVNRTSLFTNDKEKKTYLADKAEGEAPYQSVFDADAKGTARPTVPFGKPLAEPLFAPGTEYEVAPAKDVRSVPKFSRRLQLADAALVEQNVSFRRNVVNRLWAHMMGRGLVDPVDLHHGDNPPSHPELLALLADEFAAMKYDVRALLKELALTQTYQRGLKLPDDLLAQARQAAALRTRFESTLASQTPALEPLQAALATAETGMTAAREQRGAKFLEYTAGVQALAAAQKGLVEATAAAAKSEGEKAAAQKQVDAVTVATLKLQEALSLLPENAGLKSAVEGFQARGQELQTAIAAVSKTLETQQQAVATAREKADAAETARQQLAAALQAAQAAEADAVAKFESARLAKLQYEERLSHLKQQLTSCELLSEFALQSDQLQTAQTELKSAQDALAAAEPSLAAAQAALTAAAQELEAGKSAAAALQQQEAEARQTLAQKQAASESLQAAVVQLTAAATVLPDDEQLAGAGSVLKAKAGAVAATLGQTRQDHEAAEAKMKSALQQLAQLEAAVADKTQQVATLTEMVKQRGQQVATVLGTVESAQALLASQQDVLADDAMQRFAIRGLEPLSPEEITWAILQATGITPQYEAAAVAEWEKQQKEKPQDPPPTAEDKARFIENHVHEKLKGNIGTFVGLFGGGAGQPQNVFFATVDQALFFANGGTIQGWVSAGGGRLADRLITKQDPQALADELYLAVLTRRPTAQESADVAAYLAERGAEQRSVAVPEMIWALLTSNEFRFQH